MTRALMSREYLHAVSSASRVLVVQEPAGELPRFRNQGLVIRLCKEKDIQSQKAHVMRLGLTCSLLITAVSFSRS